MSDQLAIDFARGRASSGSSIARDDVRQRPRALSLDERFDAFHAANPHVFERLRRAALLAVSCGVERLSVAKLAEDLRADPTVATSGDEFKVNNSFRAPYARLLMASDARLAGKFETRGRLK
jgi:hypothetical protein